MDKQSALEAMKRVRTARGVRPEVVEACRQATRLRNAVREALRAGPATVPELSERTGLEPRVVFWYLNALRKYGAAEIAEVDGDFLRYRGVSRG